MQAATQAQQAVEEAKPAASNKVKMSFEEYQKLSFMIVAVMKEFEAEGHDNV